MAVCHAETDAMTGGLLPGRRGKASRRCSACAKRQGCTTGTDVMGACRSIDGSSGRAPRGSPREREHTAQGLSRARQLGGAGARVNKPVEARGGQCRRDSADPPNSTCFRRGRPREATRRTQRSLPTRLAQSSALVPRNWRWVRGDCAAAPAGAAQGLCPRQAILLSSQHSRRFDAETAKTENGRVV